MQSDSLTKSKYMNGLQCHKYLWHVYNKREMIPAPDRQTQNRFDQGHLIGGLARKLFPEGIDVHHDDNSTNLRLTKAFLSQRKPLFEAGIQHGRMYVRVDILQPFGEDAWEIIEVKSSTSVKDEHIEDVAFQNYCLSMSGLNIKRCSVMHINREYVRQGEIDPSKLLIKSDVTDDVEEAMQGIQQRVEEMITALEAKKCPDIDIGLKCDKPYECPLKYHCWKDMPDFNIFELYHGNEKAEELFKKGIKKIADIPPDYILNDKQNIQRLCVLNEKLHVDKKGIRNFLFGLKYPLWYMDFETVSSGVPLFDGTRPYQQVPFQYSVHMMKSKDSKPEHFSFIADGNGDPRKGFIDSLRKDIGPEGSVIVFNQSFEQGVLEELAAVYPEFAPWIESVVDRLSDLIVPFKSFNYHSNLQHGSNSLKYVLPALTGKSYEGLPISNGGDATLAFLSVLQGTVSEEEKSRIRKNLEEYCGLDTEGMIWIMEKLLEASK